MELRFLMLVEGTTIGNDKEGTMDRVTRCLHCGKRMVLTPSYTGRTELKCVFCDRQDAVDISYNSLNSGGSNQFVSDSPPSITIAAPVT